MPLVVAPIPIKAAAPAKATNANKRLYSTKSWALVSLRNIQTIFLISQSVVGRFTRRMSRPVLLLTCLLSFVAKHHNSHGKGKRIWRASFLASRQVERFASVPFIPSGFESLRHTDSNETIEPTYTSS
jgi:hypothetical protein